MLELMTGLRQHHQFWWQHQERQQQRSGSSISRKQMQWACSSQFAAASRGCCVLPQVIKMQGSDLSTGTHCPAWSATLFSSRVSPAFLFRSSGGRRLLSLVNPHSPHCRSVMTTLLPAAGCRCLQSDSCAAMRRCLLIFCLQIRCPGSLSARCCFTCSPRCCCLLHRSAGGGGVGPEGSCSARLQPDWAALFASRVRGC